MSNLFTVNPIKINVITKNNKIKQTIIFIGIVPDDVKNTIKKIKKKIQPKEINILKNFYGGLWWKKLNYKKEKIGGDEFSFEDDVIGDIANDVSTVKSDSTVKLVEKLKETKSSDDNVSDYIEIIDNVDFSDDITLDDLTSTVDEVHETNLQNLDSQIVYIFDEPFLSVYPEDKILEFKKKIYAVLNIPIFRQHIWYVYQGRVYPVNYSIFQNNSLITINIQQMLKEYNRGKIQTIESIPINQKYYNNKDILKIEAYDTFSILGDYFYKYGITEYNLLDLNDFIEPSRDILLNVIKEKFQLELIYYSFIMIYWPMLSLAAFIEYMISENALQKSYPDLIEHTGQLKKRFAHEKKIIDSKQDLITNPSMKKTYQNIKQSITNSIVYAIISVLSYQSSKNAVLHIRNLFDKLPLSSSIISCKCKVMYNNKEVVLSKVYQNNPHIRKELDINSILYKIKIDQNTTKSLNLIFYQNGNYVIQINMAGGRIKI